MQAIDRKVSLLELIESEFPRTSKEFRPDEASEFGDIRHRKVSSELADRICYAADSPEAFFGFAKSDDTKFLEGLRLAAIEFDRATKKITDTSSFNVTAGHSAVSPWGHFYLNNIEKISLAGKLGKGRVHIQDVIE